MLHVLYCKKLSSLSSIALFSGTLCLIALSLIGSACSPGGPTSDEHSQQNATPPGPVKNEMAPQSDLDATLTQYRAAIANLDRAIATQTSGLDPETEKIFSSNLAIIESSILESQQAVDSYPNDEEAKEFLLEAYQKKTDLLEQQRSFVAKIETWGRFFYWLWKK